MPTSRTYRRRLGIALGTSALCACAAAQVRYQPASAVPSPLPRLEAALYLLGDGGEDSPGRDAVLAHARADMEQLARAQPDLPIVAVFLGDNIYEVGAREEFKAEDAAHLAAQAEVIGQVPNATAVFLPGNHDWAKGAADVQARESIRIQERWLYEIAGAERARFLPADGCPGPSTLDIGQDVHLVFVDTEWLIRRPVDDCGGVDEFYDRLRTDLAANRDKRVVITAHHPMASGGPHGGNIGLFHRGPMVYYLAVKSGLGVQDLASGRYSDMLGGLRSAIYDSGTRPLAFAAGHDHSLQVIRMREPGDPAFQLVSGSTSRTTLTDRIEGTRYAASQHGYMRIDFSSTESRVVVYAQSEVDSSVRPVFHCTLSASEAPADCPEAPLTTDGS